MTQRETRISDARLAELIKWWGGDTQRALRELAALRLEGWVLVPREPTDGMKDAGHKSVLGCAINDEPLPTPQEVAAISYRAMLAAAPKEAPMTFQSKLDALPLKPMTAGEAAHFQHPPCFRCGYNSHDYYHTAYHQCAQAYHAFKNSDDNWLYARLALARELLTILRYGKHVDEREPFTTFERIDAFLAKLDSEGL